MPRYTGGQIVANYLLNEGVTHMFGVAGHGILGLLDAGYDYQDRLKMIMVRHEQVAGFMADGYYRVSHRPATGRCRPYRWVNRCLASARYGDRRQ